MVLTAEDVLKFEAKPQIAERILLYDRILVKRDLAQEKTEGGLFKPEAHVEPPLMGTVVQVGEGRLIEKTGEIVPLRVKVGDRILFGAYAGLDVPEEIEKDLKIMREDEILWIERQ